MWHNQLFWEWSQYVTSAGESPKPFSIHVKVMAFITQKENPIKYDYVLCPAPFQFY